ncbi:hypothetical protein TWF718_010464 [Orbilia javanica]|uniref:Uncharacterized protein n=1 Tax=Orbilia javanica TaxID=47235 RepID=A0AAN8RE30_9PEZI
MRSSCLTSGSPASGALKAEPTGTSWDPVTIDVAVDCDISADDLPDIFLITLGLDPMPSDPDASWIHNDPAIQDIVKAVSFRYKRYDKIMNASENGKLYENLQTGLLQMIVRATAYHEDFLKRHFFKEEVCSVVPFADTITYNLILEGISELRHFQRTNVNTFLKMKRMGNEFSEVSGELGDFFEGDNKMVSQYLASNSAKLLTSEDREEVEKLFRNIREDLSHRADSFLELMDWVTSVCALWRELDSWKLLLEQCSEILRETLDKTSKKVIEDI